VVAGEWMSVKVFMNKKGKFALQQNDEMTKLTGWWQRVFLADIDGDGKVDIVAGNYGWNSKLKPTANDPVKLFLTDLDKNGTVDPILTYSIDQKDYTFLGKGEIEKQVPLIKKKFLYYHEFAGKTMRQIFGDSIDNKPLVVNSFTSGIFYNKGNGNFQFRAMPSSMQVAPLFGFASIPGKGILGGGNFSDVMPYEGRYDADFGDVLLINKGRNLKFISPVSSGFLLRGEVRDIKVIRTVKGIIYAVAFNNKPIAFFKIND
jgi:hypothetical protein